VEQDCKNYPTKKHGNTDEEDKTQPNGIQEPWVKPKGAEQVSHGHFWQGTESVLGETRNSCVKMVVRLCRFYEEK
jgi:hypothetical protein